MATAWSRLSREQRRAWTFAAGALTVGSVVKVAYFKLSRGVMVNDTNRQHEEGLRHLKEAREFAEWSKKDRESRLPKLTDEQRQQMREYLMLIEEHGIHKAVENHRNGGSGTDDNCIGCPILGQARKALASSPAK